MTLDITNAVAIIPARGGSKRLPRKNVLEISGKPVIAYPIMVAIESGLFRRVIVSTEDREISEIALRFGAEVQSRPIELADDVSKVDDVCADTVKRLRDAGDDVDVFCCIYATAAFLEVRDLIDSYALLNSPSKPDVVMGVSSYPIHPYKALIDQGGYLAPLWPADISKKSQQSPFVVASNGTLYWARVESFLRNATFYPERLAGYTVPHDRAIDLDTPEDLERARAAAARLKVRPKN